ncbi:calcium-binding protein [Agrobacterium pusense]|uniref:calcium-binding protein n=1 Tax=Agrobacterium pusense TaxID=648995 RepID=UPI003A5C5698
MASDFRCVALVKGGNRTALLIHIAETTARAGDAGSVLVKGTLGSPSDQGLESITFADGTKWNAAQILALATASAQTGGNDTITGVGRADTYARGRHNNVINGGDGNDSHVYAHGDGDDTITESSWGGARHTQRFANTVIEDAIYGQKSE